MLFVPFQVIVAGILDDENRVRRAPNHVRGPATSTEPIQDHIRLFPEQLRELTNEFHQRRVNARPQASLLSSQRRMEIFLAYLASGGFYMQPAYSYGVATSTAFTYIHVFLGTPGSVLV